VPYPGFSDRTGFIASTLIINLVAAVRGVELDVVNLSASGALVPDLLRQQLPAWRALAPRPGSGPDVVTVLIGSNDLMNRRHRDERPNAFASLLYQLPSGAIVVTLPQPCRAAAAVNDRIEAVHVERGIRVLDERRAGPASWRGRLAAADHFHPNESRIPSHRRGVSPARPRRSHDRLTTRSLRWRRSLNRRVTGRPTRPRISRRTFVTAVSVSHVAPAAVSYRRRSRRVSRAWQDGCRRHPDWGWRSLSGTQHTLSASEIVSCVGASL